MALHFETPPPTENVETLESRREVESLLREGSVTRLQEPIREIDPSTNEVDQTLVLTTEKAPASNTVELIDVADGSTHMLALFKPFSGENAEVRKEYNIPALFVRELIAARLAEKVLKYDISPPIVLRYIDGEPGTLQQFMTSESYKSLARTFDDTDNAEALYDAALETATAQRIALFDFITGCVDRHTGNILLQSGEELDDTKPPMVAIDNAICLDTSSVVYNSFVEGPSGQYTAKYVHNGSLPAEQPKPIPEPLLEELKSALENWDTVITEDDELQTLFNLEESYTSPTQPIGQQQIRLLTELSYAKQRLQALVEQAVFLSRANVDTTMLRGETFHDYEHPHPAMPQMTEKLLRQLSGTLPHKIR